MNMNDFADWVNDKMASCKENTDIFDTGQEFRLAGILYSQQQDQKKAYQSINPRLIWRGFIICTRSPSWGWGQTHLDLRQIYREQQVAQHNP